MKITKFGHCCLLIEVEGKRILTDPGRFTVSQNEVRDIDIVLITHEHTDHMHSESLSEILQYNPGAQVITNTSVGKLLADLGISFAVLEGRDEAHEYGVLLQAFDGKHAEIFEEYGQVQNTGYFIAEKLFYPGDAYTVPDKDVPVLALPVAGPWCKVADVIKYAVEVAPDVAFPVHDGLLNQFGISVTHGVVAAQLKEKGITFVPMTNDEMKEF